MKRPDAEAAPNALPLATDEVLREWLPTLHEYVTTTRWEDGKPRKTSTVMLLCENGKWKVWVHDRDLKRSCWITGDCWEGVWEQTERSLKDDSLEWRKDTR